MITQMMNNKQVILRAAASANWKKERASKCVNKYFAGNMPVYDHRNILNIAALSIDMSAVPQSEREAYFDAEVVKIIDAFEGKTDIKPYMEKMYSLIAVDDNIDWSNEAQVENLLVSLLTNQALNTMTYDFPKETIDLYKTRENLKRIDEIVNKSDIFYNKICAKMTELDFHEQINKLVPVGLKKTGMYLAPETQIETEITEMVWRNNGKENNTVMLDAAINEHAKNFFFGKEVQMYHPVNGSMVDTNEYAKCYLLGVTQAAKHSAIEQMTIVTLTAGSGYEMDYDDLTHINGKSISELRGELKQKGIFGENAQIALGKMLRDALTDGKSVVTTTRFSPAADGTMRIEHKEVKVDLNKLNEIDRKETRYNPIRRFLDTIGLWKIQRFPTNEQRDAKQAKVKQDPNYVNSMRALEDKVFDVYNNINLQKIGRKFLTTAIPKITREEVTEDKQITEPTVSNEITREPIPNIVLDDNKNIEIEPPKETEPKVRGIDSKVK